MLSAGCQAGKLIIAEKMRFDNNHIKKVVFLDISYIHVGDIERVVDHCVYGRTLCNYFDAKRTVLKVNKHLECYNKDGSMYYGDLVYTLQGEPAS
jgi:hypothetical protein